MPARRTSKKLKAPDLKQRPPRSPRVRLGGLVLLPRMLDKCRATLAGTQGEYHYNCPMDQRLLAFLGVKADALKREVAKGKGDAELLDWLLQQSRKRPSRNDLLAWSADQEQRAPGDLESREFFQELHRDAAPKREDIVTWFDLLDVDDHVTFGGQP